MDLEERIELHIHSKEGGDSTVYVGEIMKQLSEQNIPAVAITNTSNIFCFTELEMVRKYRKYTTRAIFGMEMPVVDEEGNTYSISVLVRNNTGLKNLYGLISDNASAEDFPVYELKELLKHREGLLLGSGVESGKIYKMLMNEETTENLNEALSLFDYVEVLPFEKYESANIRIIDICGKSRIPVVAVSDAHYIDPEDRMAYKIISHWHRWNKCTEDYRFLNTEEMLKAFSYLPEDKAREVVIKNTHRIAEMCETISIIPKEKYFPKMENAAETLRNRCNENLQQKYSEKESVRAEERLETELAALQKTEMESYVLLVRELLDKCGLRACDISLRGCAAGSMVLYLMGISEVDPLKYELEPEILFGIDNDREIDIDINVPTDRQEEIMQKAGTLTGIEAAVRASTFLTVTRAFAESLVEDYMEDTGYYFLMDRMEEIVLKLAGNFRGRGKHPGGMILFPAGCDYKRISPLTKTEDGTLIAYYEYYFMWHSFIKLDLLSHAPQEMLIRLSEQTGVNLEEIPTEDSEVLALFRPDENGVVTGCADLPEFRSEETRKMVEKLHPDNFDDLVKICTLSHGTGIWEGNMQVLVEEKGFNIKDILGSRDDIFHYILALGVDRTTAFEISEAVRKGTVSRAKNAKWPSWKKILMQNGAEEWFLWSCERILYLFPKAHAVSYMIVNMKLGWFKVHYPGQFDRMVKQYPEERFL